MPIIKIKSVKYKPDNFDSNQNINQNKVNNQNNQNKIKNQNNQIKINNQINQNKNIDYLPYVNELKNEYNYFYDMDTDDTPLKNTQEDNSINNYKNLIINYEDKISNLDKKLSDKIDNNSKLMEEILSEIKYMKEDISYIKSEINNLQNDGKQVIMEVKNESLNIDDKIVKAALKLNGLLGDMLLFKKYYLKDKMTPIKNINLRHYEYWSNNKWNIDHYGKDIMEIISNNLKMTYVRVNTMDNFEVEQFVENQTHIFELTDDTYQKKLLREIVKAIASI